MSTYSGPSVVLVHGGFVDGSGWAGVYHLLRLDGYDVSIVQNPTTSLTDDVEATRRALDQKAGPVILVGHSYGGVVISEAGNHPKVAALVYIAAFAPDRGESVEKLIADPPPGAPVPPILPPQGGFLLLDRAKFFEAFAADLRPEQAAFLADSQVPWGVDALSGAVTSPAWRAKPRVPGRRQRQDDSPARAAPDGPARRRDRGRGPRQPCRVRVEARSCRLLDQEGGVRPGSIVGARVLAGSLRRRRAQRSMTPVLSSPRLALVEGGLMADRHAQPFGAMLACAFSIASIACGASTPPPAATAPPAPASATAPAALVAATPPLPPSVASLAKGAVVFDDLGSLHKAVTAAPDAQKFFDQGLRLTYGFNHDEAVRSFARGAELDPSCAMCFWGAALDMGPNYNVPMLPDRAQAAWDALQQARALAPRATPLEQALIEALAKRYKGPEPLDPTAMAPFNVAYAEAMRAVAARFPDDDDVQVLFAESLMDVQPWKLWSLAGAPAPGTADIVATLERVLARNPTHPGANHYYIHAVEASPSPEKALPAAERLPALMPGAGHIVHMPAHIYQRVGRYADASAANEKAIAVDNAYMSKVQPPGYYAMYLGHNYGFLAFSASMEGRSAASLAAARGAAKAIPPAMIDMMPGMDFFVAEPALAMVRFGRWDDLLREPRPDAKYKTLTAFWLHGHGMALAAKKRLDEARADLAALKQLADGAPADLTAGNNAAKDVFVVAAAILEARIASVEKKREALALWADAVARADKLAYSEPDDWFYSVRHFQGAAQLAAGKAKDAEATYREDLRRHPKNGWALFGLWKAIAAQNRRQEAAAAKAEFESAWAKADIKLEASAF